MSERVNQWAPQSEQCGASEWVSGASKRVITKANGLVLTSRFLVLLDHTAKMEDGDDVDDGNEDRYRIFSAIWYNHNTLIKSTVTSHVPSSAQTLYSISLNSHFSLSAFFVFTISCCHFPLKLIRFILIYDLWNSLYLYSLCRWLSHFTSWKQKIMYLISH